MTTVKGKRRPGWSQKPRTPTSPNHRPKLTIPEVLVALKSGAYAVDPATGMITNRRGRPVNGFAVKKSNGAVYRFVRIHGRRAGALCVKTLPASHVVWMSQTGRPVPKGFEIHHQDRDTANDSWPNLFALHFKDHAKLHDSTADVPF